MCKRYFLENEGTQELYGDTWPMTIYQLTKALRISPIDRVYEIGSGIGRASFWMHLISGCKVTGVEKVPAFVSYANQIKEKLQLSHLEFMQKDLLEVNYDKATLIYFYGTSFSDEMIYSLVEKWKTLQKGTRVVTTSFTLNDYGAHEYEVSKVFKVAYPWGRCEVYEQIKTSL